VIFLGEFMEEDGLKQKEEAELFIGRLSEGD